MEEAEACVGVVSMACSCFFSDLPLSCFWFVILGFRMGWQTG